MASTRQRPGFPIGRPEDKGFWEEYLKKVIDEDIQLITRWQKILDTLLVYVGLFIGVLTAFITQVSNTIQPSSGDATNEILISVYNQTMNASTPINLQQYVTWNDTRYRTVSSNVHLLYISLGVSVAEAAFALIVSIWLNRYQRSLTRTRRTIYERIMQRHEAYTGLMEWRLPILIESLPMVALLALALFASFISEFVWDAHPMSGNILNYIFIAAFIVFVFTSSFAAFIPGAPFQSPLSDFIRVIFQIFPNWSILGLVRVRTVCVIFLYISISVLLFINRRLLFFIVVLLEFLVALSLFSLSQGSRAEGKAEEPPKPRLFSLATWIYFHSFIITSFSFALPYVSPFALYVLIFFLRGAVLLVMTVGILKMSRWTTDEEKTKADAMAWMIKTQPSHDLLTFQNAVEIARNSPHLRSTLLKELLPILDILITSIRGEQDLNDQEKIYITLLAVLLDFEPCKASFWRNEAAMKRPDLSDALKEKLHDLRKGCDGNTKAEAEFILCKVGEENRALVSEQFMHSAL